MTTMDDSLEQPMAQVKAPDPDREDADDASSGDEDGGLDWSKLPYVFRSAPLFICSAEVM